MVIKTEKIKSVKRITLITILALTVLLSGMMGSLLGSSGVLNSYAASEQQASLGQFKTEGDYYYAEVDTSGKTSLGATLPTIDHKCVLSGIYTIEIYTPCGGGYSYRTSKSGGTTTVKGSDGQHLLIDVKIAKGSTFKTVGNLAEGIGIRGIIQLTGGNGANAGAMLGYNGTTVPGQPGYFGGRGGDGITGRYGKYVPQPGGSGYVGGNGARGDGNGATQNPQYQQSSNGGPGYIPGSGGEAPTSTRPELAGSVGTKYDMPVGVNPVYQDTSGSVKSVIGGAFPSFTTEPNTGSIGSIKIALKQKDDTISKNDGVINVEVTEATTWEAQAEMATAMSRIATAMEQGKLGGGNGNTRAASVVSVVQDKAFVLYIPMELDATGSFTSNNITCINNDSNDGYVQLCGVISTEGEKEYMFSATKIVIRAITEPSSSNISVLLN